MAMVTDPPQAEAGADEVDLGAEAVGAFAGAVVMDGDVVEEVEAGAEALRETTMVEITPGRDLPHRERELRHRSSYASEQWLLLRRTFSTQILSTLSSPAPNFIRSRVIHFSLNGVLIVFYKNSQIAASTRVHKYHRFTLFSQQSVSFYISLLFINTSRQTIQYVVFSLLFSYTYVDVNCCTDLLRRVSES